MVIYIYNTNMERILELSNFVSLLWGEGYNTCKPFTLELIKNSEYTQCLQEDYYIKLKSRQTLGIIKSVQIKDKKIIVGGFMATRILDDRVFLGTVKNQNAELAMLNAVSNMTAFPKLTVAQPQGYADMFTRQKSNTDTLTLCSKIGQDVNMGYNIKKSGNSLEFYCYKPTDTGNYKFSAKFGNLLNENILKSNANFKNVAIVFGQGEGDNRVLVTVGDTSAVGINRKEMVIDARDTQQEQGETLDDYKIRLGNVGLEKLAEQIAILNIGFELDTDADLGDICTCILSDFGIKLKSRIVEIQIKSQNNMTNKTVKVGTPIIIKGRQ